MKFKGYYVKCSSKIDNIAVIFGSNKCSEDSSGFIQIITENDSYYVKFNYEECVFCKDEFKVSIENNYVNGRGMFLDINRENLEIKGYIKFEEFLPIKYDAMGPFKFLPFMECRHCVVSMKHNISGKIAINGEIYNFENGQGYIEGDSGKSFPTKYFWSQATKDDISIFTSCAIIPYLGLKFNGTICIANAGGVEYRLASYLGAKILEFDKHKLVIKQGKLRLEVLVLDGRNSQNLQAPVFGKMNRTIQESLKHTVHYKLTKGNEIIFDFKVLDAAFEYSHI